MTKRPGFTLLEVVAVVALIGLLAGALALSLATEARQASRGDAVDRLRHADADARLAAQRLGPCVLRIDLDDQRLWVVTPDAQTGKPRAGHSMQLPVGFTLASVSWVDPAHGRTIVGDTGVVDLPISSAGLSRSYALELVGPPDEEPAAQGKEIQTTWLLVSGLTGQVFMENDAKAVDNLFATLAGAGPDAD